MEPHSPYRLPNGQPLVSCLLLDAADLVARQNVAHARAQAQARQQGATADDAVILWHADFPAGFRLLVCDEELFRLTAALPANLLRANGGQPLDFWDYAYLADVLRDYLTQPALPGETLLLRRALAWVEEQGKGKYQH